MIKAIIFDLDDTLYPEMDYVKSGFKAISKELSDDTVYQKLHALFLQDRKDVYQRAGFSEEQCRRCVEIYRNHYPDISLGKETKELLENLRGNGYKTGIITDGEPDRQKKKISALGLYDIVDKIIITDELGGAEYRKPHQKAFEWMKKLLDVEFEEMMYVGDNPEKDFYIGSIFPIVTVRFLNKNSLYKNRNYKNNVMETFRIERLDDLITLIE